MTLKGGLDWLRGMAPQDIVKVAGRALRQNFARVLGGPFFTS